MTMSESASTPVVLVLNSDLMLGIAITNTARSLGYEIRRLTSSDAFVEALQATGGESALAIVDMNMRPDWDAIRSAIESGTISLPILGFGPHVDVEGRRAAKQAGLTRIVSNGEFHRDMAGLIRRYARIPGHIPSGTAPKESTG
jgi:FixJ family two-component response regulator